jgi:hypothetical protein
MIHLSCRVVKCRQGVSNAYICKRTRVYAFDRCRGCVISNNLHMYIIYDGGCCGWVVGFIIHVGEFLR